MFLGCAGVERGTFEKNRWPEMELRPRSARRGLVVAHGEVFVLEGDAELVSGIDGALGIRFDEERNDLAAVTARFAAEAFDEPALLVLFTTFDDRGAGGTGYFVPIQNQIEGTGMGAIDQRAEFGVEQLVAVINLKQREAHGDRIAFDAAHEIAHRHLAYFPPLSPSSSTTGVDLLGRQRAHWHALLHSDGSLLGGHELRETEPGRFVVVSRNVRFSEVDLYALGLFTADEVRPFFFVLGGRTGAGAPIPEAAELAPGTQIRGTRIDLGVEDLIRAAGTRDPTDEPIRLAFALLTRPGESATSTAVLAEADAIDALRPQIESTWRTLTRSRGQLCTGLAGCLEPEAPDAGLMIDESRSDCGCAATWGGEEAGHGATDRIVSLGPALLLAFLRPAVKRFRCRARGRSCGRSVQRE